MFSNMSGEVRNLLLVASELGGEVAQYVKVLRKEKERLLPIDEVQGEMEKLKAERDQVVASEESMFRALTKANDSKYAERRKVDSLKEQLAKQAEQLEHMQSNMVHANVYQRVAAERDRALAELRTNEHSYMREVDTLNRAITKLEASLAEREQYEKEVHQSLITQRDDALVAVGKEKAKYEKVQAKLLKIEASMTKPMSDIYRAAFNAADEVQCDHDKVQVIAAAVASFIRSPIRGVLNS